MITDERLFFAPDTLGEALSILSNNPDTVVLAGGTDLWPLWTSGEARPDKVLSLHRLSALRAIELEDDHLRIGAACTHTDLVQSEVVARISPNLPLAAATIGAMQIQNQGTVGGNVVNASPAADLPPPLVAAEALVELSSDAGVRRVAIDAFYRGYRDIDRRPEELVTAVLVPPLPERGREHFRKVGTRRAQAISKVVGACRLHMADDGTIARAGVAFGSVGPTVVRAFGLETWLVGQTPNEVTADAAAQVARDLVKPIDDLRSSAAYRAHVCGVMVRNWVLGRD